MNKTKPDTLTDDELSQAHGGNTTPGANQHGGAAAIEREFNEWLAAHPITFPTPPASPPAPSQPPQPQLIDFRPFLAALK